MRGSRFAINTPFAEFCAFGAIFTFDADTSPHPFLHPHAVIPLRHFNRRATTKPARATARHSRLSRGGQVHPTARPSGTARYNCRQVVSVPRFSADSCRTSSPSHHCAEDRAARRRDEPAAGPTGPANIPTTGPRYHSPARHPRPSAPPSNSRIAKSRPLPMFSTHCTVAPPAGLPGSAKSTSPSPSKSAHDPPFSHPSAGAARSSASDSTASKNGVLNAAHATASVNNVAATTAVQAGAMCRRRGLRREASGQRPGQRPCPPPERRRSLGFLGTGSVGQLSTASSGIPTSSALTAKRITRIGRLSERKYNGRFALGLADGCEPARSGPAFAGSALVLHCWVLRLLLY